MHVCDEVFSKLGVFWHGRGQQSRWLYQHLRVTRRHAILYRYGLKRKCVVVCVIGVWCNSSVLALSWSASTILVQDFSSPHEVEERFRERALWGAMGAAHIGFGKHSKQMYSFWASW